MGYNLATFSLPVMGMLSDRLMNPKFAGPEDARFGTAFDWSGGLHHCRLMPDMGMSSRNAQLIQKTGGSIWQFGCRIYAGETLEVELWAKVRHSPVTVEVAIKSPSTRRPAYAAAKIVIDTAYWKCYRIRFDAPVTETNAGFYLTLLDENGILYIDQVHLRPAEQPHLDAKAIEAVKSFSPTVLRFPVVGPPLKDVTGPIHLRPAHCDFGMEEYLNLCMEADISPHLVVNIGEGTPNDAADLARYCRMFHVEKGLKPPHVFFQMGNEQYAAHELSHMTGEMYVALLRAFVPPVRKEYPDCTIIGIGYPYSGAYGSRGDTPWRERVLDQASDLVDMISNHYYKGQWKETFDDQLYNALESAAKIKADLQKMIADVQTRGLRTRIAVTEWNYWLHANNGICCRARRPFDAIDEPMDPHHCLFTAVMLHMMAELGAHVGLSTYYELMNGLGVLTNYAGYYHETPVADIFRFYRPAFPGEYLPLANDAPEALPGMKSVDAMCLKTDKGLTLFAVNCSREKEAEVELPDALAENAGEILIFDGRENGVEAFPRKQPATGRTVALPPMSVFRCFTQS
jgi:alpha-L-arabinofuranosidase